MTRGSGSEKTGSPEAEPPETGSPAVLDHLVHATPDLDRTLAEIAALTGVRPVPGGSHPGRGTLPHSLKGMGGAHGGRLAWQLTPPGTGAGLAPFLLDWGETPHPSGSALPVLPLVSLTAAHPDPGTARAELAGLGVRWPGEPVTAGPTGLTAVLAGRHGRVAFGRGAVAV
ncbi:VOC family protein [Streptomyces decoyicus]|uniref:VOC family protein n=1 Tax=Streptomyces decoyicus TaxID=249567 RepID=UPI003641FB60